MSRNTILIKGEGVASEALAVAAITPGMICELASTGKVQKQATEKLKKGMLVAIESYLEGAVIGTDYDAGDTVMLRFLQPGDEFYGILEDGENVVIGDTVEAADAGEVQKFTNGLQLAMCLEAVDASATGVAVADRRIHLRVI